VALDKLDELRRKVGGGYLSEGRPFAKFLCGIWSTLCEIIKLGHQLVFSGQSPTLFTLERGLFATFPPEHLENAPFESLKGHTCVWIILDALERVHAKTVLLWKLPTLKRSWMRLNLLLGTFHVFWFIYGSTSKHHGILSTNPYVDPSLCSCKRILIGECTLSFGNSVERVLSSWYIIFVIVK
jgi:hypothetical protein